MINGKTNSGFEFKVDERALEDWSIIQMVQKYDKSNNLDKANIVPELTDMLLGKGGFSKLEKHVRKLNDGFCPIPILQSELMQILSSNQLKNS